MKYLLSICVLLLLLYSCDSSKSSMRGTSENMGVSNDTVRIANDSLEYEILVIEPGFNAWLITQPPKGYYGLPFLEVRNRLYVVNYNQRVLSPNFDRNLYPQTIDYDPNIHYGLEVNYMLYNYFQYFEKKYNQRLR